MGRKWIVAALAVAVTIGMVCTSQVFSQQRGGPGGRGRGGAQRPGDRGPGGGGRRFDPERMRERMMDRLREYMDASEQEWQVLGPRVEKVMTLSRQLSSGGGRMAMMMFRGGPGGRRGGPGGDRRGPDRDDGPDRDLTPVQQATRQLQEAVQSESPNADEIQKRLTALRRAKEEVKQQLDKAQEDLRQLLTPTQEAKLVLLGMMD